MAIDPQNAVAEAVSARLDLWVDFNSAPRHAERALALDPGDSYVLFQAADMLTAFDRSGEGVVVLEAALRRDPLNPSAPAE